MAEANKERRALTPEVIGAVRRYDANPKAPGLWPDRIIATKLSALMNSAKIAQRSGSTPSNSYAKPLNLRATPHEGIGLPTAKRSLSRADRLASAR
jgi:hypothetical protein